MQFLSHVTVGDEPTCAKVRYDEQGRVVGLFGKRFFFVSPLTYCRTGCCDVVGCRKCNCTVTLRMRSQRANDYHPSKTFHDMALKKSQNSRDVPLGDRSCLFAQLRSSQTFVPCRHTDVSTLNLALPAIRH